MERNTGINVPRTENGKKYLENESDVYAKTDYDLVLLNEFDIAVLTPLFLAWNHELGLLIDDCEQEVMPENLVARAMGLLEPFIKDADPIAVGSFHKVEKALCSALERHVPVEFSF